MKITSLIHTDFDTIASTFLEAFKDYEVKINKMELLKMITRRGFCKELSFGAFDNDKLVSFTLNGIGKYNDIQSAYDCGTGTIEEYRGQGLATRIFEYSVPFLKKQRVKQYVLEVLKSNTPAIKVYEKTGFQVSQDLNYYVAKKNDIKHHDNDPWEAKIYESDIINYHYFMLLWDFKPTWQNSVESIERCFSNFKILFADAKNGETVGYCIYEPSTGDITQIAVANNYRRAGIGSQLLEEALKNIKTESFKIINTRSDNKSVNDFMKSKNIKISGTQFEMIKKL
jgi:ribosomal protein S18 acetylase RimI-like enzyme